VGYGDLFPVTPIGRLVAAALMMSGIAVLGVVTASIASWLVQRVEESTEAAVESAEMPVRVDVRNLLLEVAALRQELAELRRERER
jgi:voltage-gated potassium channel